MYCRCSPAAALEGAAVDAIVKSAEFRCVPNALRAITAG
jgi:hypothetical protein